MSASEGSEQDFATEQRGGPFGFSWVEIAVAASVVSMLAAAILFRPARPTREGVEQWHHDQLQKMGDSQEQEKDPGPLREVSSGSALSADTPGAQKSVSKDHALTHFRMRAHARGY